MKKFLGIIDEKGLEEIKFKTEKNKDKLLCCSRYP